LNKAVTAPATVGEKKGDHPATVLKSMGRRSLWASQLARESVYRPVAVLNVNTRWE